MINGNSRGGNYTYNMYQLVVHRPYRPNTDARLTSKIQLSLSQQRKKAKGSSKSNSCVANFHIE